MDGWHTNPDGSLQLFPLKAAAVALGKGSIVAQLAFELAEGSDEPEARAIQLHISPAHARRLGRDLLDAVARLGKGGTKTPW